MKFSIAKKGNLEFYYSFDSYQYEVSDRGAVIDQDLSADALALRHGFTDNSKHPISPFLPLEASWRSNTRKRTNATSG